MSQLSRIKDRAKSYLGEESLAYRVIRAGWRVATNGETRKALRRQITRNGIFFEASELDMCSLLPARVLDAVIAHFRPASVLDIGCGTGRSLDYFRERGIDAAGIEGSTLAIGRASRPECITQANLNREVNLGRRFDLVWSFEVVEHIHPTYVDHLVRTFANHGDRIVLSAARPGQPGEGHFNCQPPEYWCERFAAHGFRLEESFTRQLRALPDEHAGNLLVLLRA
jgi:SAM-dependent methyltransferase